MRMARSIEVGPRKGCECGMSGEAGVEIFNEDQSYRGGGAGAQSR